jgi:small-conductance mechanosensitive channel
LNLNTVFFEGISQFLEKDRYIGSVVFTWGQVFLFFFVIWLSTVVANFLQVLLEDDLLSRVKLEKGLPNTIAMLVKYTLVTIGVFLAVSAIGLPLDSITVILGAFGVGIGFGLQNIFNNLVSGLILLFERPIKINDTVEVGTLIGNVRSIGIRASNIRTFDGAEIIVPNGNLISNEVINWTLSDQKRRIEVIIGVSYGSDPNQVHDILMDVIKKHEDVIQDPEPVVLFNNLGESSLDFRCLFWTFNFGRWIVIRSEIIFAAFTALKEAGVEIPFPQRDLHLRSIEEGLEIKTRNPDPPAK